MDLIKIQLPPIEYLYGNTPFRNWLRKLQSFHPSPLWKIFNMPNYGYKNPYAIGVDPVSHGFEKGEFTRLIVAKSGGHPKSMPFLYPRRNEVILLELDNAALLAKLQAFYSNVNYEDLMIPIEKIGKPEMSDVARRSNFIASFNFAQTMAEQIDSLKKEEEVFRLTAKPKILHPFKSSSDEQKEPWYISASGGNKNKKNKRKNR